MKHLLNILVFLIFLATNAQNTTLFESANKAYNEGEYQKSVDTYLQIIENGEHSAALYYNLGNAYYKLNAIAPSIYYYEKALLLSPNDTEIENNLAYAKNMTLDAITPLPETGLSKMKKNVINIMSFDQWAFTAIGLMFLFVLSYLAFYFLKYATQKRIAFIISILALICCIAAVVLGFVQYADFNKDQPAIVFSTEVSITSEPNTRSQEVFVLHEGTKVNVLNSLDEWTRISIADGQTGWLPSKNIKLLKDF